MKRFILPFLAASISLSSPTFAQYGSQGQYPAYSGNKKIAVIMLAWSDKPCPSSRQTIVDRIWNNNNSVRNYYLDMSRGRFQFVLPTDSVDGVVPASTKDVFGPYELSIAAGFSQDITFANADSIYGGKTVPGVTSVAEQLAYAKDGFRRSNYDYVMYVTPKADTTGGIGGYAGYGATYSHMFDVRQNYLNHELGHNFYLSHSNTAIDVDGYTSQDCVMGNGNQCHLDGQHTYQLGWYPDASFGVKSYGQYDIENLAQPGSDNLKVLRFDRSAHGATTRSTYDLWIEYRIKGVGQDAGLNNNWDRKVNIHYTLPRSKRPGDASITWDYFNNNVSKFLTGGEYTDEDGICRVRFVRENNSSDSATVQLIDPDGNQPPSIPAQSVTVLEGTSNFTIQTNDPENNVLSYTILTQPAKGALGVSGNRFTCTGAIVGDYSFTVRVNDGQYDSFDVTIPLKVIGPNAPTADAGPDRTLTLKTAVGGTTPVAGAYFEWDAAKDTPANNTWTSTTNNYDWTFDGGARTPVVIEDARFDRLSRAYQFPEAKDASNTSWNSYSSDKSASFEFVIRTDGTSGSIFESGGSGDGFQVDIVNGVLRATVAESTVVRAIHTLSDDDKARFIHVIVVADNVNDVLQLYVDGQLKSSQAWTAGDDWCGSDGGSLGGASGSVPSGGDTADFTGKMALFRFYSNKALTPTQVTTNFKSLSYGSGAAATLVGSVADADGTNPSATWSVVSTVPAGKPVTFGSATSPITTVFFTQTGTYRLRLTANDGYYTASDDVTITVNDTASTNFTVTFDKQGGSGGSTTVTATLGTAMPTASAPSRTGYVFSGYYSAIAGGGTQYYTSSMSSARNWDLSANTTLYAHWITAYDSWSGGTAVFNDDSNGDGVPNGLAWLLGAQDKNGDARSRLPQTARGSAGELLINFSCLRSSKRGGASLKVQASSDLGVADAWSGREAEVPDSSSTISGIQFTVSSNANPDLIDVQASIPAGAGRCFGRLSAAP